MSHNCVQENIEGQLGEFVLGVAYVKVVYLRGCLCEEVKWNFC